MTKQLVKLFHS